MRPPNLLYAFNDKPTFWRVLLLACQYMVPVIGGSLIFPIILIQTAHATPLIAASMISVTLLSIAITTFLQANRGKFIGSGTFLPLSASPNFLAQSMLAIKIGGIPLLLGMTLLASLAQSLFSVMIEGIRKYFPAEIAALVLVLIGIELSMLGIKSYSSLNIFQHPPEGLLAHTWLITPYLISFLPLALIIIFEQWGSGFIKLYSLIIAVSIGYILMYSLGLMDPQAIMAIHQAAWLFFPHLALGNYRFNSSLILPFIIAALVNTIKICGAVSALQELQTTPPIPATKQQLASANLTDAIGSFLSGGLGSMGLNASSSSIALSLTTGITTRYIAYPFALILLALAFCPKLALIFVYLPPALVAAVLFSLGVTLFFNGLKMMLRHLHQFTQQLTIGIAFALGLSYSVYPTIYATLPSYAQTLTGSSIALATTVAVVLNFIFSRIKSLT